MFGRTSRFILKANLIACSKGRLKLYVKYGLTLELHTCAQSSIDEKIGPIDEASPFAGKEQDRIRNLFGGAHATGRIQRHLLLEEIRGFALNGAPDAVLDVDVSCCRVSSTSLSTSARTDPGCTCWPSCL